MGQLMAFGVVAAGMIIAPGADLAVVVRNSLSSREIGIATSLGVVAGLLVHSTLASLGFAAVLTASPIAYAALTAVGSAFLLYLGSRSLVVALGSGRRLRGQPATEVDSQTGAMDCWSGTRQGFLTNALNPKAPILFLSIMPAFAPRSLGPLTGTLLLSGIVVACGLLWFPALALATRSMRRFLAKAVVRQGLDIALGAVLVTLSAVLITDLTIRLGS